MPLQKSNIHKASPSVSCSDINSLNLVNSIADLSDHNVESLKPKRNFNFKNLQKPNQPTQVKCIQDKNGRSYQPHWIKTYSWIHYEEEEDLVFCFACCCFW